MKEFGIYSTDHNFDVLETKKDEIFEEETARPKWAKDDDKSEWRKLRYKKIAIKGLALFVDFELIPGSSPKKL